MGATALRKALEDAKVDPAELKLVLFAGMSRDYLPSWSVATEIMKAIGTEAHCMGLDMTIGCLGRFPHWIWRTGWLAVHGAALRHRRSRALDLYHRLYVD